MAVRSGERGICAMFTIDKSDIIAVRRALMVGGHDGAVAELRRRWPGLKEQALPDVLDRLLALPVHMPPRWRQENPGGLKR